MRLTKIGYRTTATAAGCRVVTPEPFAALLLELLLSEAKVNGGLVTVDEQYDSNQEITHNKDDGPISTPTAEARCVGQ